MPASRSHAHDEDLPIDPDVEDRRQPLAGPQRAGASASRAGVLLAISGGGVLGSLARHGLASALPTASGTLPWATFLANASGSLLLGLLTVLVAEVLPASRYVRPFLGVGLLGGYTTFSTYTSDVRVLLLDGHPPLALLYAVATVTACFAATLLGIRLGRLVETRA